MVASQKDAPYAARFEEMGIPVFDCYPKHKLCFQTIQKLRKIIKRHHIDIVYATNSKTIPNAAFASIGLPVKMVNYRGASRGLYRHDPSAYLTHLHPRVNAISCNAEAVRKDVLKRVWKNKQYVRTIYKGHHLDWFTDPPADLSSFNIPTESVTAICVANARPCKGVHVLLSACQYLADLENLYIMIIGENVDAPPYTEQRNRLAMSPRIILSGYEKNPPHIVAAGQIYIQPSVAREGMPKALIEAMAQGIAPVATDVGGAAELISDPESGYIVPPDDPLALAKRIRKLYRDPELRRTMGIKARDRIKNQFSIQQSVNGHLTLFTELLNANKPGQKCQ